MHPEKRLLVVRSRIAQGNLAPTPYFRGTPTHSNVVWGGLLCEVKIRLEYVQKSRVIADLAKGLKAG